VACRRGQGEGGGLWQHSARCGRLKGAQRGEGGMRVAGRPAIALTRAEAASLLTSMTRAEAASLLTSMTRAEAASLANHKRLLTSMPAGCDSPPRCLPACMRRPPAASPVCPGRDVRVRCVNEWGAKSESERPIHLQACSHHSSSAKQACVLARITWAL